MIGAVNLASNDDLNEYRDKASTISRAVAPPTAHGGVVADASSSDDDNNNDDNGGDNKDNNDGDDKGAGNSVQVGLVGVFAVALAALMV